MGGGEGGGVEGKRAIMRETDGRERKKDGRQKGRERDTHTKTKGEREGQKTKRQGAKGTGWMGGGRWRV